MKPSDKFLGFQSLRLLDKIGIPTDDQFIGIIIAFKLNTDVTTPPTSLTRILFDTLEYDDQQLVLNGTPWQIASLLDLVSIETFSENPDRPYSKCLGFSSYTLLENTAGSIEESLTSKTLAVRSIAARFLERERPTLFELITAQQAALLNIQNFLRENHVRKV